jgi:YfiH family protein
MMFMADLEPTSAFEWTQAPWGDVLRCRPLLAAADHFFTAGQLRLREDTREWAAVAQAIGVPADRLLLVNQVHRADVAVARRGRSDRWLRPAADIIVSDDPSSAIGVRVADCAPILVADTRGCAVAAAHAGWRGTAQGAAGTAVRALAGEFGANPRDLVGAIGPCLGPCCGEVGTDVVDAFRAAGHDDGAIARWFADGPRGRPHLDLWRANADQLVAAGLDAANVHVARVCTKSNPERLHSYRADGPAAGRMVGVIRSGNARRG